MESTFDKLIERAIPPGSVQPDGPLTRPRTYGVYELPDAEGTTRRFRMGNHPIRMIELEQEFQRCRLLFLFRARADAAMLARHFNHREAGR